MSQTSCLQKSSYSLHLNERFVCTIDVCEDRTRQILWITVSVCQGFCLSACDLRHENLRSAHSSEQEMITMNKGENIKSWTEMCTPKGEKWKNQVATRWTFSTSQLRSKSTVKYSRLFNILKNTTVQYSSSQPKNEKQIIHIYIGRQDILHYSYYSHSLGYPDPQLGLAGLMVKLCLWKAKVHQHVPFKNNFYIHLNPSKHTEVHSVRNSQTGHIPLKAFCPPTQAL